MLPSRADRLQTLSWAGVGLALIALFWALSPILTPFAVAAVLAYICDPAVNWLVTRRVPRAAAVLLVITGLLLVLLLLLLILLPMVYREGVLLVSRLPDLIELFNARVGPLLKTHFDAELQLDVELARSWLRDNWSNAQDIIPVLLAQARAGGLALLGFIANLFLIPVAMFYLLQEWPKLLPSLRSVVPRPWLPRVMRLIGDIDSVL